MNIRDQTTAKLIAHRWMGAAQSCACQYGKGEKPLGTPRRWAEHVADVLEAAGILEDACSEEPEYMSDAGRWL